MKKIVIIAFLIFGNQLQAQIKKDTLNVLFVGNSYTYYENMPQLVSAISKNTKTVLITKRSTAGGATLGQHWLGLKGLQTKRKIESGTFDIVVLQGQSMEALREPDSLRKYATLLSNLIKKHGGKPYFYLTWAREKTPKRQGEINKVYTEISKANKATLVPVGKAWAMARKSQPNIKLYNPDGSHPSKLGAYLTATVFVATISGEVPKDDETLISISAKDILFFKKVASNFILKK